MEVAHWQYVTCSATGAGPVAVAVLRKPRQIRSVRTAPRSLSGAQAGMRIRPGPSGCGGPGAIGPHCRGGSWLQVASAPLGGPGAIRKADWPVAAARGGSMPGGGGRRRRCLPACRRDQSTGSESAKWARAGSARPGSWSEPGDGAIPPPRLAVHLVRVAPGHWQQCRQWPLALALPGTALARDRRDRDRGRGAQAGDTSPVVFTASPDQPDTGLRVALDHATSPNRRGRLRVGIARIRLSLPDRAIPSLGRNSSDPGRQGLEH